MNVNLQKLEKFINDMGQNMRIKFKDFDLKNMEINLNGLEFGTHGEHPRVPAFYGPEYNMISIREDISEWNYTEEELKYIITHEFSHVASTRNAKSMFGIRSGLQRGSGFFMKNIAITEGLTEYVTRKVTGINIEIAYTFERNCAEALITILGDEFLQTYFDADCKSLYKYTNSLGISKKEMNDLFDEIDKSLLWRNKGIYSLSKNKNPKNNNQYISNIEKKLINIAARVGFKKNNDKESIANMIADIQKQFIPFDLEFSKEICSEEQFLSKYSDGLEDAFLYAKKMEKDIRAERITSEQDIIPDKKSFFKRKQEALSLPSGPNQDRVNKSKQWKEDIKFEQNVNNNVTTQNDSKNKNHDNDDLTI